MQGRPQRELRKNTATIVKSGDKAAGFKYVLQSAPKKGLVLSGGGAKGLAYCGMIQEMHKQGFLQNLTHVSGASAGAMTASLIAIGMSPEDITTLATGLDINKLLDKNGFGRARAKGYRFENVLEIIYMLQIKKQLEGMRQLSVEKHNLVLPLRLKIANYEQTLSRIIPQDVDTGFKINSVDDIIKLANDKDMLNQLDDHFSTLVKVIKDQQGNELENPRITFSDLKVLRDILIEDKPQLIKHLSVVTTNQNTKKLETYNEYKKANHSIAEIVQSSGAHPFIFSPRIDARGHKIADGGISDNMPTQPLLDAGLDQEEILCVKAEANSAYQARVKAAGDHQPARLSSFDRVANNISFPLFGGAVATNRVDEVNREKIFYNLDQMLYLDTGSITTTTVSPTSQQKQTAIDSAQQQTKELLARANLEFPHPLLGMIYLGKQYLDKTLTEEEDGDMFWAAAQAGSIFAMQTELADKLRNDESASDALGLLPSLKDFIFENEAVLSPKDMEKLFQLCIKQIDFLTEGKLKKCIKEEAAKSANSGQVAWYTWLLNLLWTPIAWIIRKLSTKERELEAREVDEIDQLLMASEEKNPVDPPSEMLSRQLMNDDEAKECDNTDVLHTSAFSNQNMESMNMELEALKREKGGQNDNSADAACVNSASAPC